MRLRNFIAAGLMASFFCFFTESSQAELSIVYGDVNAATYSSKIQEIVSEAKAPLPDLKVTLRSDACPGKESAAGCAVRGSGRNSEIYIRYSPSYTKDQLEPIFYHELGHLFDFRYLTERDQRLMKVVLGFPISSEWGYANNGVGGVFTPSAQEWFAEAASFCYMGRAETYPTYDYPFGFGRQTTSVCSLMGRASRRVEPTRQTWERIINRPQRFSIPKKFEQSSLRIVTLKIKNHVYHWGNSCESSERYKGIFVFINACDKKLSGKVIGKGRVKITYSGILFSNY